MARDVVSTSKKSFVIFGGTGRTGSLIAASLSGHGQVTIVARGISSPSGPLNFRAANVLDAPSVCACVSAGDVVIVALEISQPHQRNILVEGTQHIISAMRDVGARRLICLSAFGSGATADLMADEFDAMLAQEPLLAASFAAHADQEALVEQADLDWTIVQPTEIVDEPLDTDFRVKSKAAGSELAYAIVNSSVAAFVVGIAVNDGHRRETVVITA